jgi:excisionase family DNA binding protein
MSLNKFISTSEYAKKYGLSRMQVNRLIRNGRIKAERVGKNWMIYRQQIDENGDQIGLNKTTSLQKWNKIIQKKLHRNLDIEESKDRELIYARLNGLGLPHERCIAFAIGAFPTKHEFTVAVERLGKPYWLSLVPDPTKTSLNRLSKLGLYTVNEGWEFVSQVEDRFSYKLIVSQYPDGTDFKGTLLISESGNGIGEFVTGDRHYIMTRGFTQTDPLLFNQSGIKHFSKTISVAKQKRLFEMIRGISGHFEVQYGKIENKKQITFFDYNDEEAYTEVDDVWDDLFVYFKNKKKRTKDKSTRTGKKVLYGLPASPGSAQGRCVVVHHETVSMIDKVKEGDIIVSDTTTPEMTVMMGKAKAIITDLGGVTSHAAIVCRELKIPAVVGTKNATDQLRTGDIIRIDADKGRIELLSKFED